MDMVVAVALLLVLTVRSVDGVGGNGDEMNKKKKGTCKWQPAAVGSERLVGALNLTSEGVTTDGGGKLWFNGVSNIW